MSGEHDWACPETRLVSGQTLLLDYALEDYINNSIGLLTQGVVSHKKDF
jgi:hypothetical protein